MNQEAFRDFLKETLDTYPYDRILCAVSGGMDSMAMLHLLMREGYTVAIAHCNFQLRGEESARDEDFVKTAAENLGIPSFIQRFDTKKIAAQKKKSIQETARELRYAWFKEISDQHDYHKIATAHHLDDSMETFFMHLGRGTGIDGLTGIPMIQGNVIRPLSYFTRQEIETFIHEHQINYVEDSSNLEDTYTRNVVRHHIIPKMKEIFPAFGQTFPDTLRHLQRIKNLYQKSIIRLRNELITEDPSTGFDRIAMIELMGRNIDAKTFHDVLASYGLSYGQAEQVLASIGNQSGKKFFTDSHTIWIDRGFFILAPQPEVMEHEEFQLTASMLENGETGKYEIDFPDAETFDIYSLNPATEAAFDLSTLSFPITIRRWQAGDQMIPLGMKSKKKISDILVDEKISAAVKPSVLTWVSNENIIWLEGIRISNPVKISNKTTQILHVKIRE